MDNLDFRGIHTDLI